MVRLCLPKETSFVSVCASAYGNGVHQPSASCMMRFPVRETCRHGTKLKKTREISRTAVGATAYSL